jgi:hypothetical protein
MKKLIVLLTAVLAVLAFSASSFAAQQAQVTLTSPTIYKVGCEKAGSVTFAFDGGSVITAGDWWYFDLPSGVTLCKDYDYLIVGNDVSNADVDINTRTKANYTGAVFNAVAGSTASLGNTAGQIHVDGTANGPALAQAAGAADAHSVAATLSGKMAFLVKGTDGGQRITLYAVGNAAASKLTVSNDFQLDIKILDGKGWSDTTNNQTDGSAIIIDRDGDETYGESAANNKNDDDTGDEVIGKDYTDPATATEPNVENTLCIDASSYSQDLVFVSFASKSDKFTFTGDAQIAHAAASGTLSLTDCKGDESADIGIGGQSTATCAFNYETGSGDTGYCENIDGDTDYFENRIIIESSTGAFGDLNDKYTLDAEITSPSDGVYFTADPVLRGAKSTDTPCDDTLAANPITAGFTAYQGSTKATGYATTNCTVKDKYRVDKIQGTSSKAFELDNYTALWIDFDDFAFDSSMVASGEEVTVKVTLNRYPCGEIFTASRTIGSFVTTCSSTSSTTLYYPWLPGTAATGWWGGFVITNIGTVNGTAVLTYNDSAGGTATYTTGSISAGAQWVDTAITSSDLTDVDGYDASLNYSVQAVCGFTASGFAFTGNGSEGTGYLADK